MSVNTTFLLMRCSLSTKNVNLEIHLESVASAFLKCFLMKDQFFHPVIHRVFMRKIRFCRCAVVEKWKLQSHNLHVLPKESLSAFRTSMVKMELREKLGDKLLSQQCLHFSHIRYSWRNKYCPSHSKHLSQSPLQGIGRLSGYEFLAAICHPNRLLVCSPKSWPLVVPAQLARSWPIWE